MAKKRAANIAAKLTQGEQDLLAQMENGYQLETDSLLRRLKYDEVMRRECQHRKGICKSAG